MEPRKRLENIFKQYDKMNDAIDLTNCTYTFQMIAFSAYCLFMNVLTIYSAINKFVTLQNDPNSFHSTFWYSIVEVEYSFLVTAVLIYIINCAVGCSGEACKTPILVNKLLNTVTEQDLIEASKIFLQQISHRDRIIRTAFFSIDWTLIFSVSCSFMVTGKVIGHRLFLDHFSCYNIFSDYLSIWRALNGIRNLKLLKKF
jgi:hypothetical protein